MYSTDFNKIVRQYLSTWFGPVRYAWLTAMVTSLAFLRDSIFVDFRAQAIEQARYNSQTIILQSLLNKAFHTGNKTDIYIKNADEFVSATYLFNEVEGYAPVYLFNEGSGDPVYIYNEEEFTQIYDFIVYVPLALYTTSATQVSGIVDLYNLAGINYNVVSY